MCGNVILIKFGYYLRHRQKFTHIERIAKSTQLVQKMLFDPLVMLETLVDITVVQATCVCPQTFHVQKYVSHMERLLTQLLHPLLQ